MNEEKKIFTDGFEKLTQTIGEKRAKAIYEYFERDDLFYDNNVIFKDYIEGKIVEKGVELNISKFTEYKKPKFFEKQYKNCGLQSYVWQYCNGGYIGGEYAGYLALKYRGKYLLFQYWC